MGSLDAKRGEWASYRSTESSLPDLLHTEWRLSLGRATPFARYQPLEPRCPGWTRCGAADGDRRDRDDVGIVAPEVRGVRRRLGFVKFGSLRPEAKQQVRIYYLTDGYVEAAKRGDMFGRLRRTRIVGTPRIDGQTTTVWKSVP